MSDITPDLDDETLAFAARVFDMARHGEARDLAALLDGGLPVDLRNDKGDTLLMLASYNGGPPPTPLMIAAMFDRVEIAQALLDAGADPERRDNEGMSLFDLAKRMGAGKVPALLVERQAGGSLP